MKHKKHPNPDVPEDEDQIPVDENLPEVLPEEEEGGDANAAQKETAKLTAELQALKEKLMYLEADYQNYRKRVVKDISEARLCGTAGTLEPFLTVFDFLGMAKTAAEKSDNIESIRQGLNMIIGEFHKAFDELGVKKIATVGVDFNPKYHEAAAHEASDEVPEGKIIREWSGGFTLGERLLRPARVVVSSGPAPQETTESEEQKE